MLLKFGPLRLELQTQKYHPQVLVHSLELITPIIFTLVTREAVSRRSISEPYLCWFLLPEGSPDSIPTRTR